MGEKVFAVCRTLNAGTNYHKEVMEKNNIKVGDKIEVSDIQVGSFMSYVSLVGYKDEFNTVFFDFENENGESTDIYNNPDYQTYF